MCAIGVFGLTSFSVTRRTREIGVRMALGATQTSIQWLVMKEVSSLAAIGCAAGLAVFLQSRSYLTCPECSRYALFSAQTLLTTRNRINPLTMNTPRSPSA